MKQAKKITIGALAAGAAFAVLAATPAGAGSYTHSSRVNNVATSYGGAAFGTTGYGGNGAQDVRNSRWGNRGGNAGNQNVNTGMDIATVHSKGKGGCDTGCGTPPPPPPPSDDCGCNGHDHGGGKGGKGGKGGHGG